MKDNFVHVCFVIDESGSMSGSEDDVVGGFKSVIDEQKANTEGTCAVSYYKFSDDVTEVFKGKDVNEVELIEKCSCTLSNSYFSSLLLNNKEENVKNNTYWPHGCTALFDGVGTAIDNIGNWLNDMPEDERPEKNIIVIMTDGGENSSWKYNSEKVRDMIKHQEEKYNWSFIYMGNDITNAKDANALNISNRMYSSKANYANNYEVLNSSVSAYRTTKGIASLKNAAFMDTLNEESLSVTTEYAKSMNIDVNDLLKTN